MREIHRSQRRSSSKLSLPKLCSQYLDERRTIPQLAGLYGFDTSTITKRLKQGLGEEVYQAERLRRKEDPPPGDTKEFDLTLFHPAVTRHWGKGTPMNEEQLQLAKEARNETDPLTL